jgi:hypothetical protein
VLNFRVTINLNIRSAHLPAPRRAKAPSSLRFAGALQRRLGRF